MLPQTSRVEDELAARLAAYEQLKRSPTYPNLTATEVRQAGAYGGQQGVWVDKARTQALAEHGVAVGLRHTGRHYADDLDETGIVYHYPRTRRPTARDVGEVEAIKAAEAMGLPVFVVSEAGAARRVDLGWVVEHDDVAQVALVLFGDRPPTPDTLVPATGSVFVSHTERRRRSRLASRLERDPSFAFRAMQRYEGRCALTGIRVPEMLEAAHVIPVAQGGSDDVGNSILLHAGLHRAFDAYLWTIHPDSLDVVVRPQGPTATDMRIDRHALRQTAAPHVQALAWRYRRFTARWS